MDYATRMRSATGIVTNFLKNYRVPDGMGHPQQAAEIQDIAEAMNSRIGNTPDLQAFESRVRASLQTLRGSYKSRTWPTVAHVLDATAVSEAKALEGQRRAEAMDAAASRGRTSGGFDPLEINAARMNAGEAVGDQWLYGRQAVALMATGLVSAETLKKYRSGLFFAEKITLGHDEAIRKEQDRIDHHAACAAETAI